SSSSLLSSFPFVTLLNHFPMPSPCDNSDDHLRQSILPVHGAFDLSTALVVLVLPTSTISLASTPKLKHSSSSPVVKSLPSTFPSTSPLHRPIWFRTLNRPHPRQHPRAQSTQRRQARSLPHGKVVSRGHLHIRLRNRSLCVLVRIPRTTALPKHCTPLHASPSISLRGSARSGTVLWC
ncbi:hypothetical protein EDB19DRAFT_1719386, partial [Suillus lakei]